MGDFEDPGQARLVNHGQDSIRPPCLDAVSGQVKRFAHL